MLSARPPKLNGTNDRPHSISRIADMIGPRFMPPYSSGVLIPQKPALRAFVRRSRSTSGSTPCRPARSLRSTSGSRGMTSLRMNARTVSRICRSSSVREKSTIARSSRTILESDSKIERGAPAVKRASRCMMRAMDSIKSGGRQWARSGSTRQALLAGALEVFSNRGYEDASIAEIVERSGASVGSLYHHYGGKAGLFLEAVGPQGFHLLRRQRVREWVRRNTELLRVDEGHRSGHVLVVVLTTVIAEAGREVAASETAEEARELVDETCVILSRLSTPAIR